MCPFGDTCSSTCAHTLVPCLVRCQGLSALEIEDEVSADLARATGFSDAAEAERKRLNRVLQLTGGGTGHAQGSVWLLDGESGYSACHVLRACPCSPWSVGDGVWRCSWRDTILVLPCSMRRAPVFTSTHCNAVHYECTSNTDMPTLFTNKMYTCNRRRLQRPCVC